MKRTYKIILSLVAAGIIATTGVVLTNQAQTPAPTQPTVSEQAAPVERTRTVITYTAKAGDTSLVQLKREADKVVTQQSEYGEYVDSIEGHKGGTDGKYWSFYVDGEMASVGAGSYTQTGGEVIEWKFQKL